MTAKLLHPPIPPPMSERHRIILASASKARREMLAAAGLVVMAQAAGIDENKLKQDWCAGHGNSNASGLADVLARAKALEVSARNNGAIVIGSDQVLALGTDLLSKARDRDGARDVLHAMRGRTHELHSAAAIAIDGKIAWSFADVAHMRVRNFSDGWLQAYLQTAGDILTASVGAYAYEGPGIQLFERVDGDYFTILGLPLLPLLAELRRLGAIET